MKNDTNTVDTETDAVDHYAAGRGPSRPGWPPEWMVRSPVCEALRGPEPKITTKKVTPSTEIAVDNPAAVEARISAPTTLDGSKVIGGSRASNASVGDAIEDCEAVRNTEPKPCANCGSAILWQAPDGRLTCPRCQPKPEKGVMVVVVVLPDGGTSLEPFIQIDETTPDEQNLVDPFSVTPCPKCNSLELWQTLAGNWRCLWCDPPIESRRWAERAAELRNRYLS